MGEDNISNVETRFRKSTENYNKYVKDYNFHIRKFPESIVAKIHGFTSIEHFSFDSAEYKPLDLFKK